MKKLNILIIALLVVQIQMFAQEKTKITFGGNVTYHFGGNQQGVNSPLMFFKNGQSAGLDLTLVPKTGTTRYKLAVDYITGTTDENALTAYAKENNKGYDKITFPPNRRNAMSVMTGPQFMLFPKSQSKKLPLMWLDLKAGVMFSNQQSLQYFIDQTTPSAEIKSNSMSFVYSPTLVVNVVKTQKFFVNLKASYSNFGGVGVGVNITEQDCRGAPCYKCGNPGCNQIQNDNLKNN
jgi:hypothetical protein